MNRNKSNKERSILEKIVIATMYFFLCMLAFSADGYMFSVISKNNSPIYIALFVIGLLVSFILLIIFLSSWDNILESEDHQYR
jgi:protein-S-isoprenylcysteine O-methyltransferase Ste14